jgi:hypothetical protein
VITATNSDQKLLVKSLIFYPSKVVLMRFVSLARKATWKLLRNLRHFGGNTPTPKFL